MSSPLISVCIPVFNGEKYIRECIASVLSQSEGDFELLISDNCSTDRTLDICREYSDPRIRVLHNSSNVGSIENFNRCIENAAGEFFILLPCDDLLEEDCLKLLSRGLIDNSSVGIAYGSHIQIDHQGKKFGTKLVMAQDAHLDRKQAARLIVEKWNPMQHPMVRLKIFSDVGGFDKSFGCFCDIHLWSRILFEGWEAYVVSQPMTSIRSYKNQGQSLFLQNTKGNLKKLSGHYGHDLTPAFYKKNHFNLLFFKFIQFLSYNTDKATGEHSSLDNVMVSYLVRSHIMNLYRSIWHFNLSSLRSEASLSIKLIKSFGPFRIFNLYFRIMASFL
jgi:glycosyltransferase involved in cell wall biosynthesis